MSPVRLVPILGLSILLAYWLALEPPAGRLGYGEDLGGIELNRTIMANNLLQYGRPHFTTDRIMAPTGITSVYFSWAMERDWLGSIAWLWDRDFPFLWLYFGISLVISYLGTGFILRWMGLGAISAWALSLLAVGFHIPRHFKVYLHYEHLIHHWVYIGVFLDAWIWQRFWREKRFSWNLELWRLLALQGTFGLSGYYWGAMVLEWLITRAALAFVFWKRRHAGSLTYFEFYARKAALPVSLGLILLVIDLQWFIPLVKETMKLGIASGDVGFKSSILMVIRPLWLEPLGRTLSFLSPSLSSSFLSWIQHLGLSPVDRYETAVTIGWLFWLPLTVAILCVRRGKDVGIGLLSPFLILLSIAILYGVSGTPRFFYWLIQHLIPFMGFFRVASRMGLLLPIVATAIIVLAWPELMSLFKNQWAGTRRRLFRGAVLTFCFLSLFEISTLGYPFSRMAPLSRGMDELITELKATPGTTVLDMPFCVAGGNGVCTQWQCPNYPDSATPQFLTGWHDKKVYGSYQARLFPSQCEIYNRAPYVTWFNAWREQRCLNDTEWDQFCDYLGRDDLHEKLAGVLVYPEIWRAASRPECKAQFERFLGHPRAQAWIYTRHSRTKSGGSNPTPVLLYGAKCLAAKNH